MSAWPKRWPPVVHAEEFEFGSTGAPVPDRVFVQGGRSAVVRGVVSEGDIVAVARPPEYRERDYAPLEELPPRLPRARVLRPSWWRRLIARWS